jgi:hypothetical protein
MSDENRVCEVCLGPMPEGSRPQKTTCSGKCRVKKARLKSGGAAVAEKPKSHVVALKEKVKARILSKSPPVVPPVVAGASIAEKEFTSPVKFRVGSFKQLPVEKHGDDNRLARKVIAGLSTTKLDPNSAEAELARLLKHQLPTKKNSAKDNS